MKKVNKRKHRLPVRYRAPFLRHKAKMEALYAMTNHYQVKTHPEQMRNLNEQTDLNIQQFPDPGPLHDPSQYTDSFLRIHKKRAKDENYHMRINDMYSRPGWFNLMPGNPNTINWKEDNYWLDYNDAVIKTYGAHLKMRNDKKGYEKLDWLRKYASNSNF